MDKHVKRDPMTGMTGEKSASYKAAEVQRKTASYHRAIGNLSRGLGNINAAIGNMRRKEWVSYGLKQIAAREADGKEQLRRHLQSWREKQQDEQGMRY
jgi:hypothetical protein